MRIRLLTAYHIRIPLKRRFSHASHTRQDSQNFLIRCQLTDGTSGWGEGVPRHYVTGETPVTCFAQLAATPLAQQLSGECKSWEDVITLCEQIDPAVIDDNPRGNKANSLRCAIELSILDAYGKQFGEPVSRLVECFQPAASIRAHHDEVRYSTVIDSGAGLRIKSLKMRLYGFRQCKVKVGVTGQDDQARLRLIRRWIGQRVDLRIDANEAWSPADVAAKLAWLEPVQVSCVEQPCPHGELAALAQLRPQLTVPIMLDESLTSMADAKRAIKLGACDLFNIRLSKCGGFLASLRLAAVAAEAGIGFQLGCHPGETGILSAAGRHWATSVANVRYLEGSYDRHLFGRLLANEDLTFGYGGRAARITASGLGITVNESVLREQTQRVATFDLA